MFKSKVLGLFLFVVFLGCETSTESTSSYFGTYQLRTAQGLALPAAIAQDLEITGGSVELREDQTFTASFAFREKVGAMVTNYTDTDNGTFTKSGENLQFSFTNGQKESGTLAGQTLTLANPDITMVLTK